MNWEKTMYIILFSALMMTGLAIAANELTNKVGSYDINVPEGTGLTDAEVSAAAQEKISADYKKKVMSDYDKEYARGMMFEDLEHIKDITAVMKTANDKYVPEK